MNLQSVCLFMEGEDPWFPFSFVGVTDGARTRDYESHSLVFFQLNYGHHKLESVTGLEPANRGFADLRVSQLRHTDALRQGEGTGRGAPPRPLDAFVAGGSPASAGRSAMCFTQTTQTVNDPPQKLEGPRPVFSGRGPSGFRYGLFQPFRSPPPHATHVRCKYDSAHAAIGCTLVGDTVVRDCLRIICSLPIGLNIPHKNGFVNPPRREADRPPGGRASSPCP